MLSFVVIQWGKKESSVHGIKSSPFSCCTERFGELMAWTAVHRHEIVSPCSRLLTVFLSEGLERFILSRGQKAR